MPGSWMGEMDAHGLEIPGGDASPSIGSPPSSVVEDVPEAVGVEQITEEPGPISEERFIVEQPLEAAAEGPPP